MIPKVTHQIWFQGWDQLPFKYRECTSKLRQLNPDWTHMKWDERLLRLECEKVGPEILEKFDGFSEMTQKIDFGRYVVLYNYGGVSVDCDVEPLRPLTKIPGFYKYDLVIGKNPLTVMENKATSLGLSKDLVMLNNATICCSEKHPIMQQLLNFLVENESWNEHRMMDTQLKTGPLIISVFFKEFLDDILVLDSDVFEPFGNVTLRTVLNHYFDQTWTGFGPWPTRVYKCLKNNLILILVAIVVIIAFYVFRWFLRHN